MAEARKPAERFPPQDFIRDEMEARHWTPTILAQAMDFTEARVMAMLHGTRLTKLECLALGRAFGMCPVVWQRLNGE